MGRGRVLTCLTGSSCDPGKKVALALIVVAFLLVPFFWLCLDEPVVLWIYQRGGFAFPVVRFISMLGEFEFVFVAGLSIALVFLLLHRKTRTAWTKAYFVASAEVASYVLFSGVLVQIAKYVIARPRPLTFIFQGESTFPHFFIFNADFSSFPSGHANTYFMLSLIIGVYARTWSVRLLLVGSAMLFSLSRILLLKHYPADLLGGWMVASLSFLVLAHYRDQLRSLIQRLAYIST